MRKEVKYEKATAYKELFNKLMKEPKNKKKYKHEKFIQCYIKSNKARSQMPAHWFIGSNGTMLMIINGQIKVKKRGKRPNSERDYHQIKVSKKVINLSVYAIMALCFRQSEITPNAQKALKVRGLLAFNDRLIVCHHKYSWTDYPKLRYKLDNLLICTTEEHILMDLPSMDKVGKYAVNLNTDKVMIFMQVTRGNDTMKTIQMLNFPITE